MDFDELLQKQRALQVEAYGVDPGQLDGAARAEYVRWNVVALEDELHEALAEVRWKPWAVRQGEWVSRDAYVRELVDALHFLLNLLLVASPQGGEVSARYVAKRQVNGERQLAEGGYDSVATKDETGRAKDEPQSLLGSVSGPPQNLQAGVSPFGNGACTHCGKKNDSVRGCCPDHPGVALCDTCYMRPASPHGRR